MKIENMPFCCTSAVLGSFGEHGEPSVVTLREVNRLVNRRVCTAMRGEREIPGRARFVFATTADEANLATLLEYGFKEIDSYEGIQGTVHVLSYHAPKLGG